VAVRFEILARCPRTQARRGRLHTRKRRRWVTRAGLLFLLLLASPLYAPRLLAFPHQTRIGDHLVYSERPLSPRLGEVVARADAKVRADPIGGAGPLDQSIFLPVGGLRWHWLAVWAADAFALSRPFSEPVVVNHSDPARDLSTNGHGATRRLSDILAHEMTHGAIRARYGLRSFTFSTELVEGYCDHVAGSSTLTDAQATALVRAGRTSPALPYWRGRKKVERELAANGGDLDRLFLGAGRKPD